MTAPTLDAPRVRLSAPQSQVFRSDARFRVLVAGRRFGKSYLVATELIAAAAQPEALVMYVAPTYRMAKEIMWRTLKRMVPRAWVAAVNETDLSITLVNAARIALRGADNPDSLRGVGLDFAAPDEAADIDPILWDEVLRPALADRQGRALFVGTPKGHNWFYDLYLAGLKQEHGWRAWAFTTIQGGRVAEEEIAAARAAMDPRAFRQEFEASFEEPQGRVYDQFRNRAFPDGNVDETVRDPLGPILVGMDFNVHPMTAVVGAAAGDQLLVLGALSIPDSNTDAMVDEIRRRYPGRAVVVCPDPSGKARKTSATAGETDFTILRRAGFTVDAPSSAPPVRDRVNAVQALCGDAKGVRRLRVHPKAVALIRALDGLTYKEGTSVPDAKSPHIHITDALGYLVWQRFNRLRDAGFTHSRFIA